MKSRIKVSDPVIVISGNDKGKKGKVLKFKDKKVVVEGVNIRKKYIKDPKKNGKKSEFTKEIGIDRSNVMYCYEDKPAKLRARVNEGKKEIYVVDENQQDKVIRTISK
jgi:large subunit ribosomal protein L24